MALFDSSIPADTEAVKLGAQRIRELKAALDTVFGVYLNDDGTFKNNVVPGGALVDATVTLAKLASDVFPVVQVPTGVIIPFGGSIAPAHWVLCDGTSYLRGSSPSDTYFNLFQVLSTSYGSVDGTHFNVPDMRGRTPVGLDAGASRVTTITTLGATDGAQLHPLVLGELPSTLGNAGCTPPVSYVVGVGTGATPSTGFSAFPGGLAPYQIDLPNGSDTPHQNMQPSLGVNYIIRL